MNKTTRIERTAAFFQKWGIVLFITGATLLIGAMLAVLYYYSYNSVRRSIDRRAASELNEASLKIHTIVSSMELALKNNVWAVPMHSDSLFATEELIHHVVNENLHVMGCGIAYVPEENGGEKIGSFAYDVVEDSISDITMSRMEYDYTQREWYQGVLKSGNAYWADPYVGLTTKRLSTSYSMPVFDYDGHITAVMFIDVSLDWLNRVINDDVSSLKTSNILVSHSGEILVSPVDSLTNTKEVALAILGNTEDTLAQSLTQRILSGESGNLTIYNDQKEKLYLYYAPLDDRVGWSMAITTKDSDVYGDLRRLGRNMFLMVTGGLALLGFILLAVARQTKRIQEIKSEKERIGGELQVARSIQQSMIPKKYPPYPERDDIEIFGLLEPAKEVGGDLFDFHIRDEKLFFCIGDVSGKGIPASLVMAVTRSQFRTATSHESNPTRIVEMINETITETNESLMFVTCFVGVLDLPTGRLRYCNAGHDAPIIVPEKGEPTLLPVISNIPMGVIRDYKYEGQEIRIQPHSIVFSFTDGLTEAEDINHGQFGEERILKVATSNCREQDPEKFIGLMRQSMMQFVDGAEQSDDLTMLALSYTREASTILLKRSLVLPNDVKTVPQLNEFVDGITEELGMSMEDNANMNLAMEEAVVNVMKYAYPTGTVGNIKIDAEASDRRLKFIITDNGSPFDPTAIEKADVSLSAEDRPIGGLGIFLVRQLMDSINYERVDGCNVLTLRKNLVD
ncbi:MAG: SpoIIE family protein phosphatase [Prevotella sp.]|nr:SpoIIE family protein phosphatase [Prevotella sp.]